MFMNERDIIFWGEWVELKSEEDFNSEIQEYKNSDDKYVIKGEFQGPGVYRKLWYYDNCYSCSCCGESTVEFMSAEEAVIEIERLLGPRLAFLEEAKKYSETGEITDD